MNIWITEHLLRAEIEDNNRLIEAYDADARRKRREEGWISGWKLKTKLYSSKDNNNVENENEEENKITRNQDSANCDDDRMCTICLLDIEDGERISDLTCGHIYHAECLGEWILKKNSCPLCQNPDIATEVRSFESADEENESNSDDGMIR